MQRASLRTTSQRKVNFFAALLLFAVPVIGYSKPLFIGDSLTCALAESYRKIAPVDAKFLESTGLQSNDLLDWPQYVRQSDFSGYDTVYIVLGTNDLIAERDIPSYTQKARRFIRAVKAQNRNIVWLLPPTLENSAKNTLLSHTRKAIQIAARSEHIRAADMRYALGNTYRDTVNGVKVRTADGIHITGHGADLIVRTLL